ncbi:hypothetical protein VR45_41855 [Streptomyces sp. NRRL S-495]|nr:hypothetical protein VR45_41855 [Streptomyces sp. NRRL S-495]
MHDGVGDCLMDSQAEPVTVVLVQLAGGVDARHLGGQLRLRGVVSGCGVSGKQLHISDCYPEEPQMGAM